MVAKRKPNRGRRAQPVPLGAPVGGLNGRDGFTEMPPTDAFVLDNWFPYNTAVQTRGGSNNFATGLPGPVESVETYTGAAGSKMLAFSGGGVYDVSLGGVAGAALLAGRVSNKVTSIMFSNAGAQFLLIYSGADAPLSYDGAALAALVITGLTGSQNTLHSAMGFKGRVFLAQLNQIGFYYLGIGAIQGAASYFDLQQQALKGGYLVSMASFSVDSGNGPNDYAVFVTSEGEYIMYSGTDPSNAAAWILVGRYYGPPPIGKKGWFKYRSDIYFITEEGILSFTQIRQLGEDNENTKFITSKLGTQYDELVQFQATHGWSGMIYPRSNQLIVNIPVTSQTNGGYIQFVMNTATGAWCRFVKWDGLSWTLFKRRAYFGTFDGKVVLSDEGSTDNGAEIVSVCRQAWNTFDDERGMGEADKQFHFATFAMASDGAPRVACSMNVNYEDDPPQYNTALMPAPGAVWDTATWDVDYWAGSAVTQNVTVPVGKLGYTGSIWMQVASVASSIKWFATRIVLEKTIGVLIQ